MASKKRATSVEKALRNIRLATGPIDRKKRTRSVGGTLKKALLHEEPMAWWVFEYELAEHVKDFVRDRREDDIEYLLAVTENRRDVAMLFVDDDDFVLVNEAARTRLQELWPLAYGTTIKKLIPQMVERLESGHIFVLGIKVVDDPRVQSNAR